MLNLRYKNGLRFVSIVLCCQVNIMHAAVINDCSSGDACDAFVSIDNKQIRIIRNVIIPQEVSSLMDLKNSKKSKKSKKHRAISRSNPRINQNSDVRKLKINKVIPSDSKSTSQQTNKKNLQSHHEESDHSSKLNDTTHADSFNEDIQSVNELLKHVAGNQSGKKFNEEQISNALKVVQNKDNNGVDELTLQKNNREEADNPPTLQSNDESSKQFHSEPVPSMIQSSVSKLHNQSLSVNDDIKKLNRKIIKFLNKIESGLQHQGSNVDPNDITNALQMFNIQYEIYLQKLKDNIELSKFVTDALSKDNVQNSDLSNQMLTIDLIEKKSIEQMITIDRNLTRMENISDQMGIRESSFSYSSNEFVTDTPNETYKFFVNGSSGDVNHNDVSSELYNLLYQRKLSNNMSMNLEYVYGDTSAHTSDALYSSAIYQNQVLLSTIYDINKRDNLNIQLGYSNLDINGYETSGTIGSREGAIYQGIFNLKRNYSNQQGAYQIAPYGSIGYYYTDLRAYTASNTLSVQSQNIKLVRGALGIDLMRIFRLGNTWMLNPFANLNYAYISARTEGHNYSYISTGDVQSTNDTQTSNNFLTTSLGLNLSWKKMFNYSIKLSSQNHDLGYLDSIEGAIELNF